MNKQTAPIPSLPPIFRVESLDFTVNGSRELAYTAELFHERATLKVGWTSEDIDTGLDTCSLVRIVWLDTPQSVKGTIRIARLEPLYVPLADFGLFDTIPHGWVKDRTLVERGKALMPHLPRYFRHLFNAVFWKGRRFQRYCAGPSSLQGHHSERNGNLRHSLEVAEQMRTLCQERDFAHMGVGIIAALMHDAGKADEYWRNSHGRLELSDRGRLVGHKWTVLEWLAAARERWDLRIPEPEYLSLIHALTSSAYAPEWAGLRYPTTPEATLLSLADRLSGTDALMNRCAPAQGGWGTYHPHLKAKPFILGQHGEAQHPLPCP